ncbi:MAG: hypothetical protein ACK5MG_08700 [Bacteroidales bacterium]
MTEKDYLKDISEIKNMMNRSSRFISLSGLSGIMAGVYAMIGALAAKFYLFPPKGEVLIIDSYRFKLILIMLLSIAVLSLVTAILLTVIKAKKNNEKIWDSTTKRLLINFMIPLLTGGTYIMIKLWQQNYGMSGSLMLIFYGLALVNASKYTIGTIRYLGYAEILTGLICALLPGYSFWFWFAGFGVFHIIYGITMIINEKRQ